MGNWGSSRRALSRFVAVGAQQGRRQLLVAAEVGVGSGIGAGHAADFSLGDVVDMVHRRLTAQQSIS